MNAVATPARTKPAGTSGKPSSAKGNTTDKFTPAAVEAAFGQVAARLSEAYMTDEAHDWSGDSDRLLSIAHDLADKAEMNPPIGPPMSRVAFDIAALIRAARLVPGDGESPLRKALIDQAAVHLNWLTECDLTGKDCCDPGAPRPTPPNAAQPTGVSEEAECLELARQANYEIQKLAESMQVLAEHFGNEEHPVVNGIAARIIVLSEIVFNAAVLHGEGRAESLPLDKLKWAFKGRSGK